MSRFLFTTMPAAGHVAPKLPIATRTGRACPLVLFAPVTEHYERARERVGLPRLGLSFLDTFAGPYLYMQTTVAVRAVLHEPRYGERAHAIATEMAGYDAPRSAA